MIKLTDEAYRNTDRGMGTAAVTIDYSKAFGYVSYDIQIGKLIKTCVIKMINPFL